MAEAEVTIPLIPAGACQAHRIDEPVRAFIDNQFGNSTYLYQGEYSTVISSELVDPKTAGRVHPDTESFDPEAFVLNELNIWRLLNGHLHIVPFLGITDLSSNCLYNGCMRPLGVSLYYEKGPVRNFIQSLEHKPNCKTRLALLIGIVRGVEHIHEQMIVHGDLKGDNVIVEVAGDQLRARITDFGSSRLACFDCSRNLSDPVGTFLWDSPEVGMEETGRTKWSDIWAVGCVALEVQLDTFPYITRDEELVTRINPLITATNRQLNGLPPAERADFNFEEKEISEAVWIIIQDCWNRIAPERPRAGDLATRLEGIFQSSG
ncbi:unnamed protein product [Rhizoctonia solani]|uniref:Protein kinase domain-containing protein n=1 Tax=Rhizoctonia solani TaxID=456999 RepID=A0A8H3AY32_9AGAM|nr:unnamed protein product [Rhizoctonia solani]